MLLCRDEEIFPTYIISMKKNGKLICPIKFVRIKHKGANHFFFAGNLAEQTSQS